MSAHVPITISGTLHSDGSLELDCVPPLPAGRVRVKLESLSEVSSGERLPDQPWLNAEIVAPFDLPFPESAKPVALKEGERLLLALIVEWAQDDDHD